MSCAFKSAHHLHADGWGQASVVAYCLFLSTFLLIGGCARAEDERVLPVYFATDRARTLSTPLDYGQARNADGTLHLGRFDVRIPEGHVTGTVERPSILTLRIEDQTSHIVIREATQQSYEQFYDDLSRRISNSARKEAFVFIHGYNVSFQHGVFRTAQIAWDLRFDGAALLYSWPSLAAESAYPTDYNNNEWTIPHLHWFLEDVVARSGAKTIHLIAHSLGNRALVYAVNRMAQRGTGDRMRFNQIVLAAPDIDAGTFSQVASAVQQVAQRTTLYASSNDLALKASAKYQGAYGKYRRAGDTKPNVMIIDGIDTVDASLVDTSLLGHSYYGSNRSVLSDIFYLLSHNLPPDKRAGIRPVGTPPRRHWTFDQ